MSSQTPLRKCGALTPMLAFSVFLPIASANAQDDFCAALKTVVAGAEDGFESISDGGNSEGDVSVSLPEMSQCDLLDLGLQIYSCSARFETEAEARKKLESLKADIKDCFLLALESPSNSKSAMPGSVRIDLADASVDLDLLDAKSIGKFEVLLSVSFEE